MLTAAAHSEWKRMGMDGMMLLEVVVTGARLPGTIPAPLSFGTGIIQGTYVVLSLYIHILATHQRNRFLLN
jgi:hypothetical protein